MFNDVMNQEGGCLCFFLPVMLQCMALADVQEQSMKGMVTAVALGCGVFLNSNLLSGLSHI